MWVVSAGYLVGSFRRARSVKTFMATSVSSAGKLMRSLGQGCVFCFNIVFVVAYCLI